MTSDPSTSPNLDIDHRAGWPPELRVLLDQFPREVWPGHANLGSQAQFWLRIHNGFRGFGSKLRTTTTQFREGTIAPENFRAGFAPSLEMFLSHLNGHHQIEDHHFFPLLTTVETRLAQGFEVLESDHETIHGTMDQLVEAANQFLRTPAADRDGLRFSADAYADASDRLLWLLDRHLDDEEDLIIPLMLARGESDLGLW